MTASVLSVSHVPVAEIAAVLARLYPIESLLHVGFGSGRGELSFWKDLHRSKVVLIDAQEIDPNKHHFDGEVKAITAVVSASGGSRDWTTSQLTAENSLLSVDAHRARWPHARGVTVETIETQTLDSIVRTEGIHNPNWLVIDLHPASEVLEGARAVLDSLDVLILRTTSHQFSDWPQGAFLSETTELLDLRGLTLAHLYAVSDDRFGVAVYVRGTYKEQTTKLLSSRDGLAKDLESVRQQLGSLNQQLESLSGEKSDALLACDALAQEKTALSAQILDLKRQIGAQVARGKALESDNQQFQSTNQELTARQALFNEGLAKAEGQIELIKDLLLRDEARL